jgi:hypothetical protein
MKKPGNEDAGRFITGSEAAATFDCGAELLALAPGARVPVGLPGGFGAPGTVQ